MQNLNDISRSMLRGRAIAWGSVIAAAMIIWGAVLALPLIDSLIAFQWGCHW